jgi:fructose-1,6-bisphosphatase/sedoheptulose 1,7-bisphosphatase-like protein
MLQGVRRRGATVTTESIVMRSSTGTVRTIESTHDFSRKAELNPDKA